MKEKNLKLPPVSFLPLFQGLSGASLAFFEKLVLKEFNILTYLVFLYLPSILVLINNKAVRHDAPLL